MSDAPPAFRYVVLDGLRGVAALSIMLHHYTQHGGHRELFASAVISVDFFFCLSGFVIAYAYHGRLLAGMPLLQFYGPVSFLLALPGVLAGLAPVALWKEAMIQASVLSCLATLLGARLLGAGWRASAIAACAMAFSPWRLTVLNLRGALGEVTALGFAPLAAASALAMFRRPSRRAACVLGVTVALLVPTHPITFSTWRPSRRWL